jgi:competence protein ComGC
VLPGCRELGDASCERGFTLLENLLALAVLTFGLLASAPMIAAALKSATLAQSKACAILAAQSKVDYLTERYQHDPSDPELQWGRHGPETLDVLDPVGGTVWNRLEIIWTVDDVPDPRPGFHLAARLLTIEVRPVGRTGSPNLKTWLNRELSLSAVLSRWETP